jgi:hypothetical protein
VPVKLIIVIQKYSCLACSNYWEQLLEGIPKRGKVTYELRRYVEVWGLRHPFSQVAKDAGIDDTSVRDFVLSATDRRDENRTLPPIGALGLHRAMNSGTARTLVFDWKAGTLIEVLKNANRTTVERFLRKLKNPQSITSIWIDMHSEYNQAVNAALPGRPISVPTSSIAQLANESFEKLVKRLVRGISATQRKAIDKMSSEEIDPKTILDAMGALRTEIAKRPSLKIALDLWHGFSAIWQVPDPQQARRHCRIWRRTVGNEFEADLLHLTEKIGEWEDQLFTELNFGAGGLDRLVVIQKRIQEIVAAGRGYDYSSFRAKLLYGVLGTRRVSTSEPSDVPFVYENPKGDTKDTPEYAAAVAKLVEMLKKFSIL